MRVDDSAVFGTIKHWSSCPNYRRATALGPDLWFLVPLICIFAIFFIAALNYTNYEYWNDL